MRMNRGTFVLILALLAVIVVVLVINNNQASAPGATPTVAVVTGPILPGVTADSIVHYEVRDNASGNFASLTKDSGGAWHIDGTNTLPTRVPDQSLISTTAGQIVAINYNNTFQDDQLATFGLDKPAYTVLAQTNTGALYTVYIGSKAPTSSGYYAVVESGTAPVATEAAAAATAEATSQVAKKIFKMLDQATAEASAATAEPTAEATLDNALSSQQNGSAVVPSTAEATSEMVSPATAEATADVIHNPGVTLSGKQTIYVVPQTVIDTLTKWIAVPPYAPLPTPEPTNDTSLLAPPPTIEVTSAPVAASTESATAEATTMPTAEVTAAATAGS